ncbi:MAG: hypothetical protein IH946_02535 [Bacteroidetes bacterium]|nr:hypothetical protein [Bacteroidota bacterium]
MPPILLALSFHEYAHGLSFQANSGSNIGKQRRSLDEAIADYLCASYSRSLSEFNAYKIFNWDGHNEYWPGRTIGSGKHWPEDTIPVSLPDKPDGDIHRDGEIFASMVMEIYDDLGKDTTDMIAIQSMFYYVSQMSYPDAALTLVEADSALFNGQHTCVLLHYIGKRGYQPAPVPYEILSSGDAAICVDETTQLDVAISGSGASNPVYQWIPSDGLSNSNIKNPTASPDSTTDYKIRVWGDNGCFAQDELTVTYANPADSRITNANDTLCFDSSITLTAIGGNTYSWEPAEFVNDPSAAVVIATPPVTTRFKVDIDVSANCFYTDSVDIVVRSCGFVIEFLNSKGFAVGENLYINFPPGAKNTLITMYDMSGRIVQEFFHPDDAQFAISGYNLYSGMFILELIPENLYPEVVKLVKFQ